MEDEDRGMRGAQRDTPYLQWQRAEGIPTYTGAYVEDLHELEVGSWPRTGQKGAFVNLAAQEIDDGQLLEIAPGGDTEVQHHLYETMIYVVEGRGATTLWQQGKDKQTIEWQQGSLFSPPLNCYYQHFNLDGDRRARLYAATTAPAAINLYRDPDFIFTTPYAFTGRYDGEEGYFSNPAEKLRRGQWKTNFLADLRAFPLDPSPYRGGGGSGAAFLMSGNSASVHISEFPPGMYKKAHRHGAGAHIIVLTGKGYSLLHFEGHERVKADWKDGGVVSPRHWEYHQHFNTGPVPARYLAVTFGGAVIVSQEAHSEGNQIEYDDEDPEVYALYERECAKNGAEVLLARPAYAGR